MSEIDSKDVDEELVQQSMDELYHEYVHRAVDAGVRDSEDGRVTDHTTVRRQFGLS